MTTEIDEILADAAQGPPGPAAAVVESEAELTSTLDDETMTGGTTALVSPGALSFWILNKLETRTPEAHVCVATMSGVGTWERTNWVHPSNAARTTWLVDVGNVSGTADDANDGATETTQLLTTAELRRRVPLSGSSAAYTFRPGIASAGTTYATWAEIKPLLAPGVSVRLRDDLAECRVLLSDGTSDCTGVLIYSECSAYLNLDNGVVLNNALHWDNAAPYSAIDCSTIPLTFSGETARFGDGYSVSFLYLHNFAGLEHGANATVPMVDLTAGKALIVSVRSGGYIFSDGAQKVFRTTGAGAVIIRAWDEAYLDDCVEKVGSGGICHVRSDSEGTVAPSTYPGVIQTLLDRAVAIRATPGSGLLGTTVQAQLYEAGAVTSKRKTVTLTVTAAMCALEGSGSELTFPFAAAMPAGAIFVGAFVDLTEKFTDSAADNRWGVGVLSSTANNFVDPDGVDGFWKRSWCGFTSVGTAGTGASQALGKNAGPNVWAADPYNYLTAAGWVGNAVPGVYLFATEGSSTDANLMTAGSVTATVIYDDYTT